MRISVIPSLLSIGLALSTFALSHQGFAQNVVLAPPVLEGELSTSANAGTDSASDDSQILLTASGFDPQLQSEISASASGQVFDLITQQPEPAVTYSEVDMGYSADAFTIDASVSTLRGAGNAAGIGELGFQLVQKKPIPRDLPTTTPGYFDETYGKLLPVTVPVTTQLFLEGTSSGSGNWNAYPVEELRAYQFGTSGTKQPMGFLVDGVAPFGAIGDGTHDLTYYLSIGLTTSLWMRASTTVSSSLDATSQAVISIPSPVGVFDQALFEQKWNDPALGLAVPPIVLDDYYQVVSLAEVAGGVLTQSLLQPSISLNTSANYHDFQNAVAAAPQSDSIRSDDGNSSAEARADVPAPGVAGGTVGVIASADSISLTDPNFERARAEATLVERYHIDTPPGGTLTNGRALMDLTLRFDGIMHLEQKSVTVAGNGESSWGQIEVEFYVREADGTMTTIFLDTVEYEIRENSPVSRYRYLDALSVQGSPNQGTVTPVWTSDLTGAKKYDVTFDFNVTRSFTAIPDSDLTVEARIIATAEANYGGQAIVDFFNTAGIDVDPIPGHSALTPLAAVPEAGTTTALLFGLAGLAALGRKRDGPALKRGDSSVVRG